MVVCKSQHSQHLKCASQIYVLHKYRQILIWWKTKHKLLVYDPGIGGPLRKTYSPCFALGNLTRTQIVEYIRVHLYLIQSKPPTHQPTNQQQQLFSKYVIKPFRFKQKDWVFMLTWNNHKDSLRVYKLVGLEENFLTDFYHRSFSGRLIHSLFYPASARV